MFIHINFYKALCIANFIDGPGCEHLLLIYWYFSFQNKTYAISTYNMILISFIIWFCLENIIFIGRGINKKEYQQNITIIRNEKRNTNKLLKLIGLHFEHEPKVYWLTRWHWHKMGKMVKIDSQKEYIWWHFENISFSSIFLYFCVCLVK